MLHFEGLEIVANGKSDEDGVSKRVLLNADETSVTPDPGIVNTYRDVSFGLDQANIEYDQLNVSGTLVLDGEIDLSIELQNGYTPVTGEFYDLITADTLMINGNINVNGPIINDLTFGYEKLTLFDPGAGFNRDVLRVSYGVTPIPEPGIPLVVLAIGLSWPLLRRPTRCANI
ncbi:MAG: hypothetical protein AAF456_07255, partial [Planctomycetota bacterium]